jgi:hypothetical protein
MEKETIKYFVKDTEFITHKSILTSVPDSGLEAFFSGRHQLKAGTNGYP